MSWAERRRRPTWRAVVAIIDVLRASTSIAVALANGAQAVIPVREREDVVCGQGFERPTVRLAGERRMPARPGLRPRQLAVSEFTREAVEGKTVLFTTTNGTAPCSACRRCAAISSSRPT